ncbi:MAG: hypothetical protein WCL02_02830 [bacterium]
MKKFTIHLILVAIAIILTTTVSVAQQNKNNTQIPVPKEKIKLFASFVIEPLLVGSCNVGSTMQLKNIPVDIRNVPKHPSDDVPTANMGPIQVSSLSDAHFWWKPCVLFLNAGFGNSRFDITCGAFGSFDVTSQDLTERNYTNYPGSSSRGLGAALTFIRLDNSRWHYGYTGSLEIKMKNDLGLSCMYLRDWEHVNIVTGWDRYDDTEKYTTYNVGTFSHQQFLIGPEYRDHAQYFRLSFGYSWNSVSSMSSWGQVMDISVPNYFTIKLAMGFAIDTRYIKN